MLWKNGKEDRMTPETIEKIIDEARGLIEGNASTIAAQQPNQQGVKSFSLRFELREKHLKVKFRTSQSTTDETEASLPDPNQEEMPL